MHTSSRNSDSVQWLSGGRELSRGCLLLARSGAAAAAALPPPAHDSIWCDDLDDACPDGVALLLARSGVAAALPPAQRGAFTISDIETASL